MGEILSNRGIAESFLNGLRSRNQELLRSIFDVNITWSMPGAASISGEAVGQKAVLARADHIASFGVSFRLKHLLFGQHGFALSLNNKAQRGSHFLDEHLATVCMVRDGQIMRIDTFLSDVPMMEVFFGS